MPKPHRKHRARKHLPHTKTEPAVVRGIITSIIAALAAFGFTVKISEGQVTALAVVVAALIPLVQALWTRYAVTANAKVIARVTTTGTVVAGDAAVSETGSLLPTHRRDASPLATLDPVRIQSGLVAE